MIAATCQDSVIIGCDSLAASGSFISTRFATQRVQSITSKCILCSASCHNVDFNLLVETLRKEAKEYSSMSEDNTTLLPTTSIAKRVQQLIKSSVPQSHVIVAGVDASSRPECYEILPGGSLMKQRAVVVGSASPYVIQLANQLLKHEDVKSYHDRHHYNDNDKENNSSNNNNKDNGNDNDNDSDDNDNDSYSSLLTAADTTNHVYTLLKRAIESDLQSGGKIQLWSLDNKNGLQAISTSSLASIHK